VQIGASAGPTLTLSAEMLRTSGLELLGAGIVPPEALREAMAMIWTWIAERKLTIDIEEVPLREIATAWNRKTPGDRIVLVP
jgi:NADPH:quinone reductase-like Zn-dependent oxidoreductase